MFTDMKKALLVCSVFTLAYSLTEMIDFIFLYRQERYAQEPLYIAGITAACLLSSYLIYFSCKSIMMKKLSDHRSGIK